MLYKVINGKHMHYDVLYRSGDVIDTPMKLDKLFPNKFQEVMTESKKSVNSDNGDTGGAPDKTGANSSAEIVDVSSEFKVPEGRDLAVHKKGRKYMLYDTFEEEYVTEKSLSKKGMEEHLESL